MVNMHGLAAYFFCFFPCRNSDCQPFS
jgi:hypothetical protein